MKDRIFTDVWIEVGGVLIDRIRPHVIHLESPTKGTIVKDGRRVELVKDRWVYRADSLDVLNIPQSNDCQHCHQSLVKTGACLTCSFRDLPATVSPCADCVHRNTQCNWEGRNKTTRATGTVNGGEGCGHRRDRLDVCFTCRHEIFDITHCTTCVHYNTHCNWEMR